MLYKILYDAIKALGLGLCITTLAYTHGRPHEFRYLAEFFKRQKLKTVITETNEALRTKTKLLKGSTF